MRDLLDFLSQRREDILRTVVLKLRADHPDLSDDELRFGMRDFLEDVIAGFTAERLGEPLPSPGKMPAAARHGEQRRALPYDPASVVRDYGYVCDAVFELAQDGGTSISAREVRLFNRFIDAAGADAISAYWREDKQHDQRDTIEHVGALAHELRNSLGSARMAFEFIQSGRAPAVTRAWSVLKRALDHMQQLIGSALTEVRAGNYVDKLAPAPLDVVVLVRDVVDATKLERGIVITLDGPPTLDIEADGRLLTSALSNLLQNACKFTHPDGKVGVRLRQRGPSTVIEVQDECGGLPDGAADELFEPFVQKATNRSGIGLGLTIARKAIQAHGGTLTVRNHAGVGCVFRIELPNVARECVERPVGDRALSNEPPIVPSHPSHRPLPAQPRRPRTPH
ncbi:MAG TPA: HAMP domain-containing sensor histidine kinase [Polyangia bacterium]|jgi:hypothetical protein|nr:HAMP domain-containing sensor histidine kinase [Polyangia bacterium]